MFLEMIAGQLARVCGDTLTHLDEQRAAAANRGMAEALQRSLLREPVQPDHLEIAVRYLPAVSEAEIGGDWYDAFLCQDGATWLVVCDVAGHDQTAAAVMAEIRNLLRGIAYTLQSSPAAVLTAADAAMAGLGVRSLTTVVAVRIEQNADDEAVGVRRVRWANAGHPAPLLLRADGAVEALDTPAETLLGVRPDTVRTDHETVLSPGEGLLLYTDGLIERRDRDLDQAGQWLLAETRNWTAAPLDALCDHLLATVAGHADDDIVLLALRAHPQNGARPIEAGPQQRPATLA